MTRLALCVLFVACSHPAPVAPTPAPENQAVTYAHLITKESHCTVLGDAAALCDFGRVLAYCHVGNGAPSCDAFADLRPQPPKPPEEKKPEPPIAAPTAPASSAKPDSKPDSKEPPKK